MSSRVIIFLIILGNFVFINNDTRKFLCVEWDCRGFRSLCTNRLNIRMTSALYDKIANTHNFFRVFFTFFLFCLWWKTRKGEKRKHLEENLEEKNLEEGGMDLLLSCDYYKMIKITFLTWKIVSGNIEQNQQKTLTFHFFPYLLISFGINILLNKFLLVFIKLYTYQMGSESYWLDVYWCLQSFNDISWDQYPIDQMSIDVCKALL